VARNLDYAVMPLPLVVLQRQFGMQPGISGCLGCAFVKQFALDDGNSLLQCLYGDRRHIEGECCRDYTAV